jgi:hypothetical protein
VFRLQPINGYDMNRRRAGIIFILKVSEKNDCKMYCSENYTASGGCLVHLCGLAGSDQVAPAKAAVSAVWSRLRFIHREGGTCVHSISAQHHGER